MIRSWHVLHLAGALPYLAFAAGWGLAFGTTAHIRWTLTIPLFSSYALEASSLPSWDELLQPLILFLSVAALSFARRLLPAALLASPLPWIAGALAMMALPRWGIAHFGAVPVLAALAAGQSIQLLRPVLRRTGRRRWSPRPLLLLGTAGGLLAVQAIILLADAGPVALDHVGGPALWWNDEATRNEVRVVRERIRPGERFFNFLAARESIYALTGTFPSASPHLSVGISWVLNKDGLDRRLVEGALAGPWQSRSVPRARHRPREDPRQRALPLPRGALGGRRARRLHRVLAPDRVRRGPVTVTGTAPR